MAADPPADLLADLDPERREHVETRLRTNLMAWLSTVSPSGRPDTVPVWFLHRDDGTFVLYSQPGKVKLRNIAANPHVGLALDVTDIGRDIIRFTGTAVVAPDEPAADHAPAYVAKYTERIGAIFGSAAAFAAAFSEAIVITPTRAHISEPSPGATA
ncbi:TIGR03667 family PPOX class F420-dependent oxidoreductase [Desertimonas flava]|uniref:TIGR03667 family PPOX class F420-dependent oxidoreductase n=1 Tax=Desertimonas flava TaxID=2064846 RepID=UPI000E3530A3|nr:TIGR03667 family PPOX class F420-dependent oxidoreductase [Desertimonas flava]